MNSSVITPASSTTDPGAIGTPSPCGTGWPSTQVAWLEQLAAQMPGHRILLFSHHQPFSYFESQGPKLVQRLQKLLLSGRVAAWYWGHEHSCLRYDLHPTWKMYGRCVGHSGFPYFRLADADRPNHVRWRKLDAKGYIPGGLLLDGPNDFVKAKPEAYGPNGYLMLELRGKRVHESYCDPLGTVLDEFDFEAAP